METAQEGGLLRGADPLHLVERGLADRPLAQAAVVGDREAVRLVAEAIAAADILLLTNEVPEDVNVRAAEIASAAGVGPDIAAAVKRAATAAGGEKF